MTSDTLHFFVFSAFDFHCKCRKSSKGRFSGVLSDVMLGPMGSLPTRDLMADNITVLVTDCRALKLGLDFTSLPGLGNGHTFKLKVTSNECLIAPAILVFSSGELTRGRAGEKSPRITTIKGKVGSAQRAHRREKRGIINLGCFICR